MLGRVSRVPHERGCGLEVGGAALVKEVQSSLEMFHHLCSCELSTRQTIHSHTDMDGRERERERERERGSKHTP